MASFFHRVKDVPPNTLPLLFHDEAETLRSTMLPIDFDVLRKRITFKNVVSDTAHTVNMVVYPCSYPPTSPSSRS